MGHKIKYGAKFFLKIKYFPYLPTHFLGGHVTGNQHIIYFGLIISLNTELFPPIVGAMDYIQICLFHIPKKIFLDTGTL